MVKAFYKKRQSVVEVGIEGMKHPLRVTPRHRFFVEGRFVPIGLCGIGQRLLVNEGDQIVAKQITSCLHLADPVDVFNVTVLGACYFAGGVLVHNLKPRPVTDFDSIG